MTSFGITIHLKTIEVKPLIFLQIQISLGKTLLSFLFQLKLFQFSSNRRVSGIQIFRSFLYPPLKKKKGDEISNAGTLYEKRMLQKLILPED